MKKTNKNYQRLSIFFLMILGMFIVSCKNPLNLKHNSKDAKKAYIRISTNLSDSKVRSALPESFYDSEKEDTKSGLIWELSGEGPNESFLEKIWEDDSATETTAYKQMLGDTSIELDVGTWTFTLTAYVKNSDDIQEKVLESTIQKTIVSGQNSLSFEMEEAVGDEGVANGEISFTLNFPQNQIHNLAITLYKYPAQDGKYIPLDNQANQEISNEVSSYTYEYSNIESGNYLLEIALQQKTGLDLENNLPSYTTINTYTCVIHVAPGLKSVGSYNLSNLAKLYQISYKYIDGETIVDAQFNDTVTTSYNKYQTFTLPTPPTRTGYEFVGWYTSQECSGEPITEYNIPDDFAAEKIVFYAKWEEIGQPVVLKYFYQDENKQSTENPSNVNIETTTSYTKLSVSSLDDSHSPWAYFAQTSEEITFGENINYKVSVDLKAKETTVIAIAAARADMYFTVGTEWETYEFETGNLASELKKEITFGVGASEETYIKNLKIEECEESTLPTLSFNVTMPAIKTYLQSYFEGNKCIIDVSTTKNQNNDINGYCIKINTPLSHVDESSNSVVQDVTLELRGYAETKGLNAASFYMTSTDTELKTSLVGSTTSSSNYVTRWNKASDITTDAPKTVYFPAYEDNEEYAIDGVFSGGTKESTEVTITDFEVVNVTDLTNTGKVFAIKTIDEWQKYTGLPATSRTVTIENNNSIVFDVLLVDNFDEYPGENNGDHWDDCTRFLYSTTGCNIGDTGLSYSKGSENGNDTFNIRNNTGSSKDIAITLKDDFTVLIEEVTGTNNDQLAGGEMGLLYDNTDASSGKLRIRSEQGLNLYRDIVNGTLTQDLDIPYMDGTSTHPISKNQTYALEALLESNITVSDWVPIGTEDKPFISSFDGQGHSITINSMSSDDGEYAGVFGCVGNQAADGVLISNIVVKGPDEGISTDKQYSGGIVAFSKGATIKNCVNKMQIINSYYSADTNDITDFGVGGIVGFVQYETVIDGCVNFSNLVAKSSVGGIVGKAYQSTWYSRYLTIKKCVNLGSIMSYSTGAYVSGILGYSYIPLTIQDSINIGERTFYDSSSVSYNDSGFVFAKGQEDNSKPNYAVTISNCINAGSYPNGQASSSSAFISEADSSPVSGTYTNLYYNADKWVINNLGNLEKKESSDDKKEGIMSKTTEDLTNGNKLTGFSEDNWSFAEGRYPLPNILKNDDNEGISSEVWAEIVEAAK